MRPFTDDEKKIIKQRIMSRGKSCFAKYGIKKTSIEDLTKDLGIAKSSFYSIFDSKEDLFLQIINEERKTLKYSVLKKSFLKYRTEPDKAIRAYISYVLYILDTQPLWKNIFTENFDIEINRFSEDRIKDIHSENLEVILPFFKEWKESGLLVNKSAKFLAETTQSLLFLAQFKDEIGRDDFPEIMKFLIDLLVENIVDKESTGLKASLEGNEENIKTNGNVQN